MITTPAQRRATANAFKKREASGLKRSTFWLTPEARAKLEADKAATGKPKDQLVNEAILANRLAPPVQDTKAGPESAIESMQARRAKGPERPKTLSPTLPAGDPVKAATKAPEADSATTLRCVSRERRLDR
jgi:hypothetical protein